MKKSYLNKLKTGIPYGLGNLALGIYSRETLACVHALGRDVQECSQSAVCSSPKPETTLTPMNRRIDTLG